MPPVPQPPILPHVGSTAGPASTRHLTTKYPVPYSLTLSATARVSLVAIVMQGEAGIPDDTYILDDWYCPNPHCDCQDVLFCVFTQLHGWVAWVRMNLKPLVPGVPVLDQPELARPYAAALLSHLVPHLADNPDLLMRLRDHYHQVKAVDTNPSHPTYHTMMEWGRTGGPPTGTVQKRKRKSKRS